MVFKQSIVILILLTLYSCKNTGSDGVKTVNIDNNYFNISNFKKKK